jgi:plasmid stabilization system protein ParE
MASPNERDEVDRSYQVELKETAEAEAEAAYLWMSQRSPEYAIRWYRGLLEAIAGLTFMPRRFPVAPESEAVGLEVGGKSRLIRQRRYGRGANTWRVLFYIVEEDATVWVLHVRHSSRPLLTEETEEQDDS